MHAHQSARGPMVRAHPQQSQGENNTARKRGQHFGNFRPGKMGNGGSGGSCPAGVLARVGTFGSYDLLENRATTRLCIGDGDKPPPMEDNEMAAVQFV